MSKKTAGLARTHIRQYFDYFKKNAKYIFDEPIKSIGITDSVYKLAKSYGIKTLSDLEIWLDEDEFVYEFESYGKKLSSFARSINELKKRTEKELIKKTPQAKASNKTNIKKIHIDSINKITKQLSRVKETGDTELFEKTLKEAGASPYCYNHAKKLGLSTINDIYVNLDRLIIVYKYVQTRLKNLAENIEKICFSYLKASKSKKTKVVKSKKKQVKVQTNLSNSLLKKIDDRANGCCLCCTFSELARMSEIDFASLMKKQYPNICDYKLSKEKIKSWIDEFKQFTSVFIPVFKKQSREILDFHIIFELQLPKFRTDLESQEYVYSDAVIVGSDGFVVLEFKQRDSNSVDVFVSQALKYIKRLRYHRIGRKQTHRYTYLVCTKEKNDGVWCYDDKENFWFGNSKSVANDLLSQFFDDNEPFEDIKEWLAAGFKEKRSKN